MAAIAAIPKYAIGDEVVYEDHHRRLQNGKIISIEANWSNWSGKRGAEAEPHVTYTLHHPTYRNNRYYAGDRCIHGLT